MPNLKATKVLQKRSDAAVESFHKYYAGIWGEDRWHNRLFPALSKPTRYCALVNAFCDSPVVIDHLQASAEDIIQTQTLNCLTSTYEDMTNKSQPLIFEREGDGSFPPPIQIPSSTKEEGLLSHWNLDFASVLAASVVQVQSGDKMLDLCAAPGGKSIVLAQLLWSDLHHKPTTLQTINERKVSMLHSNEADQNRSKRLSANLRSYLPADVFTDSVIKVTRIDGTTKSAVNELPLGSGAYDKVLVDAPCSSERHIIHTHLKAATAGQVSEEMSNWKPSHSKTLAKVQIGLLLTAIQAVKVNGIVVYATCSLSSEENDGVVERTLEALERARKKGEGRNWTVQIDTDYEDDTRVKSMLDSLTEKTAFGRIALPDHHAGGKWGPLYFCRLRKITRTDRLSS